MTGLDDWVGYVIPGSFSLPVTGSSKLQFACSGCNSSVSVSLKALKEKIKRGGPFLCASCAIKLLWRRPGFRDKISQENIWSNPSLRAKISVLSKKRWEDPAYVARQKAIHEDPSYLRETRDRSKSLWDNEAFREHQRVLRDDPSWKLRQSASMQALWDDPDYVGKVRQSISKVFRKGIPTSIEMTTANILEKLNIKFEREFPVGPFSFDFFLPDFDVLVECQGEYWHSLPKAASRDAAKFSYVSLAKPASRVLYLHERDFLNPLFIEQKVLSFIGVSSSVVAQHDFVFPDVDIRRMDVKIKAKKCFRSPAQELLDSFHYAQYGRSAKAVYGAFLGDVLISVCKFSTVVRKEVATSLGLLPCHVLELDRFCIHPSYQKKNFASWLLSRCSKAVFSIFPSTSAIVSFSDMTVGHIGTMYRASNWEIVGIVPPDYHYVNSDGWVLHKKTLWNHASRNGSTEREYAELHGYSKVFGREKFKFVMKRRP
jgi:hypothetical protein